MKSFRILLLAVIVPVSILFSCNNNSSKNHSEFVASQRQLTWLKKNVIPIKSVDAGNGFEDLEEFKKIVGNARIVGLGENTHGTSEVFRMKHRLVEFLVEEMGFTVFAIEGNLPEAYKINDYVLKGEGDPKTLLKGLHSWPWNTQEVLDMILWMREYNASGKGKIQFTGFDMSTISGAFDNLKEFSKNEDKSFLPALDSISDLFHAISIEDIPESKIREIALSVNKISKSVGNRLLSKKNSISKVMGEEDYNLLLRNAEIIVQSSDTAILSNPQTRDKYMAQNAEWILENNRGSKIILWAHSGHIRKLETYMGGILAEKYGDDYVNIGFLSNSGTYTATDKFGWLSSSNRLEVGKPGSFEYSFHKTGIPCFCIDFKKVNGSSSESRWLNYELKCGGSGSYVQEIQYYPVNISKQFNAVIFIDSTRASRILGAIH